MSEAFPTWAAEQAGEALDALARAAGLPVRAAALPRPPEDPALFHPWLESAATWLDLEVEETHASYPELETLLRRAGPALLRLPDHRLVALLGGRGAHLWVLGTDLRRHRVPLEQVRLAFCAKLEAQTQTNVRRTLAAAGLEGPAAARVTRALNLQALGGYLVPGCWIVRLPPSAPFWQQLRVQRVHHAFVLLLLSHVVEYSIYLSSWTTLGAGALSGHLDLGWLVAWGLLLLSLIPFRLLGTWAQGQIAVGGGGLLKRRMLLGALRLSPEEVRHQGAGAFLGQVIESEQVEALALSGGLLSVVALVELVLSAGVLARGAGGLMHAGLLAVWVGLALLLAARFLAARHRWTEQRLGLTHLLVERMVGHRTRIAQQAPRHWHDGEDEALTRYLDEARGMDQAQALLATLLPRGWVILGLLGLLPAFISGADPVGLTIGVGGVMLSLGALGTLSGGVASLGGAWIAWQRVRPLFDAAARDDLRGAPGAAFLGLGEHKGAPGAVGLVMEAHGVSFRYHVRGERILSDVSLRIHEQDRILLEGPSGGGKSTLASVLVGLREPGSGLLLMRGLDRATLGSEGWRRRVVSAPQFHENHVLTGTFAFNLLMGKGWPADQKSIDEAEALCRELGLGPLLSRMPAGMMQMVGETGWQLSHGEKSRLFLARALLQGADLVVLDESFAALDPENLALCLKATLARAPALIVIAHP